MPATVSWICASTYGASTLRSRSAIAPSSCVAIAGHWLVPTRAWTVDMTRSASAVRSAHAVAGSTSSAISCGGNVGSHPMRASSATRAATVVATATRLGSALTGPSNAAVCAGSQPVAAASSTAELAAPAGGSTNVMKRPAVSE